MFPLVWDGDFLLCVAFATIVWLFGRRDHCLASLPLEDKLAVPSGENSLVSGDSASSRSVARRHKKKEVVVYATRSTTLRNAAIAAKYNSIKK